MSFKFITDADTLFTALDAETLSEFTQSGMFTTQVIEKRFRLGNTGASITDFAISASGLNADIIDDVDFSLDNGATFITTATVSGIQPNEITDSVIVRYSSQELDVIGIGSFLIRVDEESS